MVGTRRAARVVNAIIPLTRVVGLGNITPSTRGWLVEGVAFASTTVTVAVGSTVSLTGRTLTVGSSEVSITNTLSTNTSTLTSAL